MTSNVGWALEPANASQEDERTALLVETVSIRYLRVEYTTREITNLTRVPYSERFAYRSTVMSNETI